MSEIPRKALLRAVPAYEDARVGGDSSTAAMHAALVAARPYLMPSRDALVALMNTHAIEAFNGSQVVCECNLTWVTNSEYRAHLADAVLALLNGGGS